MRKVILNKKEYNSISDLVNKKSFSNHIKIKKSNDSLILLFQSDQIFDQIFDEILGLLSEKGFNTDESINFLGVTLEKVIDKFLKKDR